MKWIRWQGLIAFALIMGCMAVFWFLLADWLVERALESAGTAAIGAKVELTNADLSLSPLGLTLMGLEVTDPEEPMTNALEARRLAFLMDGSRLLIGKVLIDEMSAEGIRFGTERSTSGAMDKATRAKPAEETEQSTGKANGKPVSAGLNIPDVDEILEREELESLKLAEKVSSEIKQKEDAWDSRIKTLPDSQTLKGFESRYKDIERKFKGSTKDKLKAISDASRLQKDIKAARDTVMSAAWDLEADYKKTRADINAALRSPERDLERIKRKYQVPGKGAGNLSSLVFGPVVRKYIARAGSVYSMLKPFIDKDSDEPVPPERGRGADVKFREFNPAPALWVRTVMTDMLLSSGPVAGTVRDISSDQALTGKPTTFVLSADDLEKADSIKISGGIDHRDPRAPRDDFALYINGHALEDMKLSESGRMPVTIRSGTSDTTVNAQVRAGGRFDAKATVRVTSTRIESEPSGGDRIAQTMGRTLSSLKGFSVDVKAKGTLSDYSVSVSSDMDKALKAAVGGLLKEESRKFETRLREAIKAKTNTPLSGLKGKLSGLEERKSSLTRKSGSLDSLFKQATGIKAEKLFGF